MRDLLKNRLHEELTKADKEEIKDMITKAMDSSEVKSTVEKMVKDQIKGNKALEDKVVDITKNVLTQLYKTLWVKRNFWKSTLKNKAA